MGALLVGGLDKSTVDPIASCRVLERTACRPNLARYRILSSMQLGSVAYPQCGPTELSLISSQQQACSNPYPPQAPVQVSTVALLLSPGLVASIHRRTKLPPSSFQTCPPSSSHPAATLLHWTLMGGLFEKGAK